MHEKKYKLQPSVLIWKKVILGKDLILVFMLLQDALAVW